MQHTIELLLNDSKIFEDAPRLKIATIETNNAQSIMKKISRIAKACEVVRFQTHIDGQVDMAPEFISLTKRLTALGRHIDAVNTMQKLPAGNHDVLRIAVTEKGTDMSHYDLALRSIIEIHYIKKTFRKTVLEHNKKMSIYDMSLDKKPVVNVDPSKTWIISDLHFDHSKIIGYCRRPFKDVDEMNDTMLENWNSTVHSRDSVFFLGDMSHGRGSRNADWWLQRLHGKISFICGNHDTTPIRTAYKVYRRPVLAYCSDTRMLLSHYPYRPKMWKGWIIHGHVHNNHADLYPRINYKRRTANISAEYIGYKPKLVADLLAEIMKHSLVLASS